MRCCGLQVHQPDTGESNIVQKWIAFLVVSIIWGSSFLLIRIGVDEMSPFQVVFIRTVIAAIGLNAVLYLRGDRLPLTRGTLLNFLMMGIVSMTIPFGLIAWGEVSVDSGLASVLNSTAALFTLIIAHFAFVDERITPQKIIGVVVGFIGVIVLFSRSLSGDGLASSTLAGQLAIVLASLFYGIGGVQTRKTIQRLKNPLMVSAGTMLFAAITSGIAMLAAPVLGGQPATPLAAVQSSTLLAVIVLGILNTFVAYLMFYWVIQQMGSAKASMVTYVVPVVGVGLGVLIGDTVLDVTLVAGALLIASGIVIVNVRRRMLMLRRAPAPAGD